MDLRPLFSLTYWFDLDPEVISNQMAILLFGFFALVILGGITARIVSSRWRRDRYKHQLWQRAAQAAVTMGLVGLFFFFFLFENIRFFGARFWYLFWLIGAGVWIWHLVRFATKVTPAAKARDSLLELRDKYLPRPRKK
jgi:hypothetical protein